MTRRKVISLIIIAVLVVVLLVVSVIFWNNFRGIIPLLKRPSADITEVLPESQVSTTEQDSAIEENNTNEVPVVEEEPVEQYGNGILELEPGFIISLLSGDVPAARSSKNASQMHRSPERQSSAKACGSYPTLTRKPALACAHSKACGSGM